MSHVRIFALCLLLLFAFLVFLLFAVHMEAVAPANGMVTARDLHEARTHLAGLVEPGWYEGELILTDGSRVAVRLDAQGNGSTDPAAGTPRDVLGFHARDGGPRGKVAHDSIQFHHLQAGDLLWAGQPFASLRTEEWKHELDMLEATDDAFTPGMPPSPRRLRRDTLRNWLSQAILHVPTSSPIWQTVSMPVGPLQNLAAGDLVAVLVPWDTQLGQPRDLTVRLKVEEGHLADIAPGQSVRLLSSVYNQRLHGTAEAVIQRVEPWGEPGSDGQRRFIAVAAVRAAPFALPLGSTCRAEIVVGRKLVYRIILEH